MTTNPIFRKTIQRIVKQAGTTVNGYWAEGIETQVSFVASLQPLNAREMAMLPEARKNSQSYKLYSDTKIFTVEPIEKKNPDIVLVDGERFEVIGVYPYQSGIINNYKIIISKENA